jgi:hypothetical protein
MNTETIQYIYIIQPREFYNHNELVYKIGKTKKLNLYRFNQYPKGSVLLFQMVCKDCDVSERKVIKHFTNNYKHRKDVGAEYFEGDFIKMIDDIYNILKGNIYIEEKKHDKKVVKKVVKKKIEKKIEKKVEIDENKVKEKVDEKVINKNEVVNEVVNKVDDRKCPKCLSCFKYPSGLKKHLELSVICCKSKADIDTFFATFKKNTEQKFSCNRCFTSFVQKSGLNKHIKHSKCGKKDKDKIIQITNEELQELIKKEAIKINKK